MLLLNEQYIDIQDFKDILAPWKDFPSLLAGELKRTVVNLNTALTVMFGPSLSGADYGKLIKKNRDVIAKIDGNAEEILAKNPVGVPATVAMWVANPGIMAFDAARRVSKKVSVENVDTFMREWGFDDLALGPLPVGRILTGLTKTAAKAGGFATLARQGYQETEEEAEESARTKWYTPLERLFLLQNPFKSPIRPAKESFVKSGNLLLEAEDPNPEEERKAFEYLLNSTGFTQKHYSEVGLPYIEAHKEMYEALLDAIEQDITDASNISASETFPDFAKAVQEAEGEKFKAINVSKLETDIEGVVTKLTEDEEGLIQFLEAAGKTKENFQSDDDLRRFVLQKIYEKEFSAIRKNSIESIEDATQEVEDQLLGDMERKDLEDLRGSPVGDQLYNIITDGLERLDKAVEALKSAKKTTA